MVAILQENQLHADDGGLIQDKESAGWERFTYIDTITRLDDEKR